MAPPRHDRDAGGPAELLKAKAELRDEIWAALRAAKASRFPAPEGRIPNFVGAEAAAERLRSTDVWRAAATLKANPDSPQWPVRQRALEDGKLLFMAVPRLAGPEPFFLLDPERLAGSAREASSIKGASKSARPVGVDELKPVDLVVAGTVAAGLDGARLGKGGGFSDLEFAVASEAGLIGPDTVVVTTVHEVQVLAAGRIPTTDHDVTLDLIVTPERVIECRPRKRRRAPGKIRWDELTDEKIAAIPLLGRLMAARAATPAGRERR
jgi:5-formyltetrahydrofolate cyclo-ligase